jgi:hypothetical protein
MRFAKKEHKEILMACSNSQERRKNVEFGCIVCIIRQQLQSLCEHHQELEDPNKTFLEFGKTHLFQEVWRLKVAQLSHLHTTATTLRSLGFVIAKAQDGSHKDVQSV